MTFDFSVNSRLLYEQHSQRNRRKKRSLRVCLLSTVLLLVASVTIVVILYINTNEYEQPGQLDLPLNFTINEKNWVFARFYEIRNLDDQIVGRMKVPLFSHTIRLLTKDEKLNKTMVIEQQSYGQKCEVRNGKADGDMQSVIDVNIEDSYLEREVTFQLFNEFGVMLATSEDTEKSLCVLKHTADGRVLAKISKESLSFHSSIDVYDDTAFSPSIYAFVAALI
ncbi:hypothetical protein PCE1_000520 [Barthelona sp. PCE]